jgi:hypothetical protein
MRNILLFLRSIGRLLLFLAQAFFLDLPRIPLRWLVRRFGSIDRKLRLVDTQLRELDQLENDYPLSDDHRQRYREFRASLEEARAKLIAATRD